MIKKLCKYVMSALLAAACAKKTAIQKPSEFYQSPSVTRDTSHIIVKAAISTLQLQNLAEKHIPNLLYDDDNIEDDNYIIKVFKRDKLKFYIKNGEIHWTIPLQIYAKARLNLGFFKSEQDGHFLLDASFISLPTVSSDWNIRLTTYPNGFEWKQPPTVKLGFVEVNVGQFINPIIESQLSTAAKAVDKFVADMPSAKPLAASAFQFLQTPIDVLKNDEIWVKFTPTRVALTPISGDSNQVFVQLGIKGISETYIGKKPSFKPMDLLPLHQEAIADSVFILQSAIEIPFIEMEKKALLWLKSQTFEWDNGAKKVQVENFSLYGSGKNLTIKTTLKGSYNGTIFLTGMPAIDTANKIIYVKNLDFELDTKNKLNKAAAWLLNGILVQKLKNQLKYSYKSPLEAAVKDANQAFSSLNLTDLLSLHVRVKHINPYAIELIENNFLLRVKSTGILGLTVDLKP